MSGDAPLTHVNDRGEAHVLDIGAKDETRRIAVARASLRAQPETIEAITANELKKGDAMATARIAGIMAAKKTADIIPLCHPVALTHIAVDIDRTANDLIEIRATAETHGRTGVEMEALTAATTAALTLYDMAKAMDRGMAIEDVALMEKSGGKSGDYKREV